MHYFKFNIGDYASHTQHLSLVEDLAYRRMLESYYLAERPLNAGITSVARQIRMREYETEVKTVLEEFFILTDDGWVHSRAERDIADYRGKIEQASKAGKASAERRLNARSTDVQPTNNHKPLTNNQEPISVTDVTGDKSPDDMAKDELWKAGKSLLSQAGMPRAQCGSFVGKLVKDYGDQIVIDAVRAAVVARPADPAEYMKAACMHARGQRLAPNRQEALEQRNRAIANEWASQGETHETV